jgi:hypothetical protein
LTKRQRHYADIAGRHTPAGIKVVFLDDGARASEGKAYGLAHRFPEDEEEEENFVPWIEVPRPTTIRKLWTYLHETVHIVSSIPSLYEGNNYSNSEPYASSNPRASPSPYAPYGRPAAGSSTRPGKKEFGAEYSAIVIECLGEFDQRIAALEMLIL